MIASNTPKNFEEYLKDYTEIAESSIPKYNVQMPNNQEVQKIVLNITGNKDIFECTDLIKIEKIRLKVYESSFDQTGNRMYSNALRHYWLYIYNCFTKNNCAIISAKIRSNSNKGGLGAFLDTIIKTLLQNREELDLLLKNSTFSEKSIFLNGCNYAKDIKQFNHTDLTRSSNTNISIQWDINEKRYCPYHELTLPNFLNFAESFNQIFDRSYQIIIEPKERNRHDFYLCKKSFTDNFSISKIIDKIKTTGLIYSENIIKRFAFALMSKRFLILSGLAGSGKTQLALAFAKALVEDKEKQMCVVSVGADWTNREPLLGFPNALKPDSYILPESGVLQLLIEANKTENKDKPYFLILDEMNMSYVERYFADFLSAMESHEDITLWDGSEDGTEVPKSISLPDNLFIIGTINVDETTYMFSPKVLDRANVIEFKISNDEMSLFLDDIKEVHPNSITGKGADMAEDFVKISRSREMKISDTAKNTLKAFFNELKTVNAEFGYRSATEIFRFISQASQNDDTQQKMTEEQIIDAAIVQKLLPKLHGSRKKLVPVLETLWNLCFENQDPTSMSHDQVENAIFKETADKLFRMYEAAQNNGFTSFAEA